RSRLRSQIERYSGQIELGRDESLLSRRHLYLSGEVRVSDFCNPQAMFSDRDFGNDGVLIFHRQTGSGDRRLVQKNLGVRGRSADANRSIPGDHFVIGDEGVWASRVYLNGIGIRVVVRMLNNNFVVAGEKIDQVEASVFIFHGLSD